MGCRLQLSALQGPASAHPVSILGTKAGFTGRLGGSLLACLYLTPSGRGEKRLREELARRQKTPPPKKNRVIGLIL